MNRSRPKALCVGLSPEIAREVHSLLSQEFDCADVATGEEAQHALNDQSGIALLITDGTVQESSALELQRLRQQRWPDTVGVMFLAGNALETALAALQEGSVYRVVRAPWRPQSLATTLAEARAYFDMRADERR